MKNHLLLVLLISFANGVAIASPTAMEDVIRSMGAGNAHTINSYMDQHVNLVMPSKSDSYSCSQAGFIVKEFFRSNGVKKFEVKQKVNEANGQFCTGILYTSSGSYRTTIFMALRNGKSYIREIRFQPV